MSDMAVISAGENAAANGPAPAPNRRATCTTRTRNSKLLDAGLPHGERHVADRARPLLGGGSVGKPPGGA